MIDPAQTFETAPPAGLAGRDERPRLLVVDDQPMNLQTLYALFSADHHVFMAMNGEQALALCGLHKPDLVLLDVMMPTLDGHEVCRRLVADPATRDIPVIFLTAHDSSEEETAGLAAGAVDFITKPINPAVVRARVRTHLTLKRQGDLLRQWAYVDGLTGVHNRRAFDERLQLEWDRAMRQSSALSLLMIDVDHFKRFNDHYGHQAGDDVLRRVATALSVGLLRSTDLLARYGGEEFVCLLPETPEVGALELARSLARRIEVLAIEHADSPVAPTVTVSLGVASSVGGSCGSWSGLLVEADKQLYAAKSGGRNRACAAAFPQG